MAATSLSVICGCSRENDCRTRRPRSSEATNSEGSDFAMRNRIIDADLRVDKRSGFGETLATSPRCGCPVSTISHQERGSVTEILFLVGRLLFGGLFLYNGINHFTNFAATKGYCAYK